RCRVAAAGWGGGRAADPGAVGPTPAGGGGGGGLGAGGGGAAVPLSVPARRQHPAASPRFSVCFLGDDIDGQHSCSVAAASCSCAVVEVDHAVAEAALVQQLQRQADIGGEGRCAASHQDGRDEQVVVVHEPGPDRLGGELRAAHGEVTVRQRLHLA